MEKGYIHVYTGNGKGKTTAAFGLALRAAMAGKKVYIGQFVKGMAYSETKCSDYIAGIEIEQYGTTCYIDRNPDEEDVQRARRGLEKCKSILASGAFDVVVLDEIFIAVCFKLLKDDEVLEALKGKAEPVEVVLTGRYASEALIEAADLVTEMREIKHYYTQGVLSREGIDC
ncbi:cob(I)yrinic acid a,c-diamide adenosyltransferase [Acidaminobacter hydrogenoformans]|uniref:Cob(I)alamin adenosyltransferase n=1 Tax=Acidaminobacter hydrogenoformans DSM 2784 TaxID=1120920 RepID=A0A1G5RZT2_9FIRM|nr:cob(I)yrinic acid a,c-diamide adenosyltransferase [Acidaminobacter hydrogenoformans]SCZ78839.1 cob(I)alamin adenosyltransferase [Acidaminobacter hydrogenoformans DSM 2784]